MTAPRPAPGRFSRFLFVGGGLALLNLALLWLLVERLRVPYLAACTLSFFALNALGYLLNKVFTFELGPRLRRDEMLRYYGVMAASLAANLVLMALLVEGGGFGVLPASVVVTALLAVANFGGHSRLTFGRHGGGAASGREAGLRVLQVSAFFPAHGGGIEVVAWALATRLPQPGLRLCWMAGGPRAEWPADPGVAGLRVLPVPAFDPIERRLGLPAPLWGPRALWRLWREVGMADIVHIHDYLYMPTLAAALFARIRGRALVITQHIGEIPFASARASALLAALNRHLGAPLLARAAQTVFIARPVMEHFERLRPPRRPAMLVPNGVDHTNFSPGPERPAPPAGAPVRLLFVGRFVAKKGLPLLRASAALPGAHWTFVGAGPLSPADWGVPGLALPGRLPAAQIAAHYRQADLLVLPSTGEGFPLVLQEALACGSPVLVSAEVAAAFPALDPRCVFAVELRVADPAAALHAALAALVADPARLAAARAPALALSRQWSWDACAAAYREIYRACADRQAVRARC